MCAVVNTVTNKVVRLMGKDEAVRFMNVTLYQGAPAKTGVTTLVSCKRFLLYAELRGYLIGYGCFCESHFSQQGNSRSNIVLHRLQETKVFFVHALRARVRHGAFFYQST